MRIYFFSSFFNHHQKYLCDALYRETGGLFRFIETMPMPQERVALGYSIDSEPYVRDWRRFREDDGNVLADAVIMGSAPEKFLEPYIKKNIPIFRFSERPLRKGLEPLKYPVRFVRYRKRNPASKPIYLLCAGAYTALDYHRFGMFGGRMFRWGYFPAARTYDSISDMLMKKDSRKLLWAGRFIPLKHPDAVLRAAKRLHEEGVSFSLDFIGMGEMENMLREYINEHQLTSCVRLLPSMPPDEVRSHMEQAGIYLFTSDGREGWGAVLNESMNSGCAVIASHAVGSVPYLIKNGENGLVYRSGDEEELYRRMRYLLENPHEQKQLGGNAYRTIVGDWNADTAAKRLLQLMENLRQPTGEITDYPTGPCGKAEIIRENQILLHREEI